MKKILIVMFLLYAPYARCQFKTVQDSTLDALQLYEKIDDVSDEKEISVFDQQTEEKNEESGFDDLSQSKPQILEKDPEQYFVDKKDVQERINQHEILEYTLDEILDRAREYPGYYGDSDKEEITQWYEDAQNNSGYQKEILDHIKDDSKKHSLEKILEHAQIYPLYKGLIPYQKIVDTYYQMRPEKISMVEQAFAKAIRFLHLDNHDDAEMYVKDMKVFLMEYRKLSTSLQNSCKIETLHGVPSIDGQPMKSAKNLADWIVAHKSNYPDLKQVIALLKA